MEIHEKIEYLLKEKGIKKVSFVKKLLALEPKLKRSGLVPTEQTIYRYLSGSREIKIELIPYIAEVLEVGIGELFEFDIEYASGQNIRYSRQIREIIELFAYVPNVTIEKIKRELLEYKKMHEKQFLNNPQKT